MKGDFSVVLCKKKNPIWGSVVDGRFQPSKDDRECSGTRGICLGSAQHGHPFRVGNAHLQQNPISDSYIPRAMKASIILYKYVILMLCRYFTS